MSPAAKVRDRLRAAKWRTWHFDVPVADEATIDAAREALAAAEQAVAFAEMTEADVKAAEKALAAAKAKLADCFERIEVRPLTSDADMDALLQAHPVESDAAAFNLALLMACLVDDRGMSQEEWRDLLDSWPRPDRNALFALVREANMRPSYDAIPKG